MTGPLTTDEVQRQHLFWTKRAQRSLDDKVTEDKQKLGLEENDEGIFRESRSNSGTLPSLSARHASLHRKTGRRRTPAHLAWGSWPDNSAHQRALLGSQAQTSSKKSKSKSKPLKDHHLETSHLIEPKGVAPFQVVGVDFAGPIKYRVTQKKEGKAYIILYACSLTRALYFELSKSMEASEFLRSLRISEKSVCHSKLVKASPER